MSDIYPLSIVTGTRDRPEAFRRLLLSIARHTTVNWELIVADASSVPYDIKIPSANIVWLPEHPRLGMVKGYNRAFAAASGKWVIWLNDDCEVLPGYDTAAIDFMEAHPEIGLGALYYSEEGVLGGRFHINHYLEMGYANFGIIRRDFGNELGWFDDDLKMYGSDNALTFKVLLAGKGLAGIPDAKLLHKVEHDAARKENQKDRRFDSHLLRNRYMPKVDQMRVVHDQYRRIGGAWEL